MAGTPRKVLNWKVYGHCFGWFGLIVKTVAVIGLPWILPYEDGGYHETIWGE